MPAYLSSSNSERPTVISIFCKYVILTTLVVFLLILFRVPVWYWPVPFILISAIQLIFQYRRMRREHAKLVALSLKFHGSPSPDPFKHDTVTADIFEFDIYEKLLEKYTGGDIRALLETHIVEARRSRKFPLPLYLKFDSFLIAVTILRSKEVREAMADIYEKHGIVCQRALGFKRSRVYGGLHSPVAKHTYFFKMKFSLP
jgi:hypothetical protein